ncbi:MAG: hypothetical protein ABEJ99_05790 [Candidatus Nanohaloarchaea archaeon]
MAAGVSAIITGAFNNPTVFGFGVVVGFIVAKAMNMRKRNNMGMGGFP